LHARARKERDLDGRDRRNRANWRCLIEPLKAGRCCVCRNEGRFPLLAPSRHDGLRRTRPLLGVKRT
jgi:hypothetical protein